MLAASGIALAKPYPDPQGWVNDFAGVIERSSEQLLESKLAELERKTGAEVALVTVLTVPNRDIERAAVDLFQQWGIGKKGKDNGVLILCAVQDRKIRMEVGYGLEEILPDAKVGRMIDQQILPHFRKGNLSRGLVYGTLAVADVIAQASGITSGKPVPSPAGGDSSMSSLAAILFLLVLVGVFVYIASVVEESRHTGFRGGYGYAGGFGGGGFGGGFGGGGFGGFGGGGSGGGGASGSW